MKTSSIVKLSVLILIFLIIIVYRVWIPLPAAFLLVKDNLHQADCIVPVAGDPYFRQKKVVELYNKGYSKNIVVSVTPEREEELKEYHNFRYRMLGVKELSPRESVLKTFEYFKKGPEGIYFTESEITSTYDEAQATKDFMLKKGFKSLILVTSTYHTRRALITFGLVFRGSGIKIYNSTAENILLEPRRWWLKETDVKSVSLEYLSIAYNILYHFILRKEKTAFDTF